MKGAVAHLPTMANSCNICGRSFTRYDNLSRHLRLMHPSTVPQEAPSVEEDIADSSGSDADAEEAHTHWRLVLIEAIKNFPKKYSDPSELLRDPLLSEFIEELRSIVESRMAFADAMQGGYDLYSKIELRTDSYEKDGCSSDEAAETAWNDLRIVVRNMLQENMDLFGG